MKYNFSLIILILLAATACNLPGRIDAYTTISNVIVSPSGVPGQFTLNIQYQVVKVGANARIYCSYVTPDGTSVTLGEYTPSGEGASEMNIPLDLTQHGRYTVSCTTETESTPVTATFTFETVTISGNAGVGGATLIFTGGSSTADGGGNYSITVPSGWAGTIGPSLAGYTFEPASKSYTNVTSDQAGQDYTAASSTAFIISGNAGVAGATLNYTGGPSTADAGGSYSITVPSGWSGTITPSLAGYTFFPASKSYTDVSSSQAGQDYIAIPPISALSGGTLTYDETSEVMSPHKNEFSYYPSQHHKWCGILLTIDPAGNISGTCSGTEATMLPGLYGDWSGGATIEGTITGTAVPGGSFTFTETLIERYKPGDPNFEHIRQVVITGMGSFVSSTRATGTATMALECRTVDEYSFICADDYSSSDSYTGTINWEFNATSTGVP